MTAPHDLTLLGCTPEPLLSYLKALGIFRLVATQADSQVKAYWKADQFHLVSDLTRDELVDFLAYLYRPTPVLSPWNGGGGFFDSKAAGQALMRLEQSTNGRLEPFRQTATVIRTAIREAKMTKGVLQKDKTAKAAFLRLLRSSLPDEALDWIDATAVLAGERARYAPLLGVGGCDGNLDFSTNFVQRLEALIPFDDGGAPGTKRKKGPDLRLNRAWASDALFADGAPPLLSAALGQYNPGGIGGPNATQGFEGTSLVNPWDYILMLEGALVLAGAAARRLGADTTAKAAFPFTVDTSTIGWGTMADREEASSRSEVWLPLWARPAGFASVRQLFAEGRAQLGRRQAHTGLDFARAVAGLGVDKGIAEFQRFGFMQRNGLAFLATPLGRMAVQERPQARLIDEVDTWLFRLHKAVGANPTGSLERALRAIEQCIFAYCEYGGPDRLQDVLAALGRTEMLLATAPKAHEKIEPLQGLSANWLSACNDERPELRLAAALSSISHPKVKSIRFQLEPVVQKGDRIHWGGDASGVVRSAHLLRTLAAILDQRLRLGAGQYEREDERNDPQRAETTTPIGGLFPASLSDVHLFLTGQVDDQRIADLMAALCAVRWNKPAPLEAPKEHIPELSRVYALLKLLFLPGALKLPTGGDPVRIMPEPTVLNLLRAGNSQEAVAVAYRRLRASGLTPLGWTGRQHPKAPTFELGDVSCDRLLAALLIPIREPHRLASSVLQVKSSIAANR